MSSKIRRTPTIRLLILIGTSGVFLLGATANAAVQKPLKEIFERQFGRDVNKTKITEGAPQAERDVCTVESKDDCQSGTPSSEAGGFHFPEGVAVGPTPEHYVYIADTANGRIDTFTPDGAFVSMYGWKVNKTKSGEGGATQREKDVCTAAEINSSAKVECQAGQAVANGPPGQIQQPTSISVDQSSGDIYVLDVSQDRVEKYTSSGEFILMVGGEVNETRTAEVKAKGGAPTQKELEEENICTDHEVETLGVKCKSGVATSKGATTPGAFKPQRDEGNLLAVGGPKDLLYVGDEGRVQEFETDKFVGEMQINEEGEGGTLAALLANALAVDQAGNLYVTGIQPGNIFDEKPERTIHKLEPNGAEVVTECSETISTCWPLRLVPVQEVVPHFLITTLAIDPAGRLAVAELEESQDAEGKRRVKTAGSLFWSSTGEPITDFALENKGVLLRSAGLAFAPNEIEGGFRLYAAAEKQEMLAYKPAPVSALVASATVCTEGAELEGPEQDTDATLNCDLNGEINPEGVAETVAWFQYGATCASLDKGSLPQPITTETTFVPVSALIEGLHPNESAFCYRLEGEDENVKPPEEPLRSKLAFLTTPLAPPRIVGVPSVSFVRSTSAVMLGELNPENARTEYLFEYAPGADGLTIICKNGVRRRIGKECVGVATTQGLEAKCSQVGGASHCPYGKMGVAIEANDMQPATVYHYRLTAENESIAKDKFTGEPERRTSLEGVNGEEEGTFETAPAPAPTAVTGPPGAVGVTSALVSGMVDPDGRASTYSFEVGIYDGKDTQFGTVFTGSAGNGHGFTTEQLELTGLQPGTDYAYRISIESAGHRSSGAAEGFTTDGLANVLKEPVGLPMLLIPNVDFPIEARLVKKCRRGYVRDKRGKCVKKRRAKRATKVRRSGSHHKGRKATVPQRHGGANKGR